MTERIKPAWMHDCKFIDELEQGETGYCLSWAFVKTEKYPYWFISRDHLCSPINRGTHNVAIQRHKDQIYVRDGHIEDGIDNIIGESSLENAFPVEYKPYTIEEKIDILWNERK